MDVEDESGADLLNSLSDPGQTKVKSYEELCRRRKNMTHAVWHPELQLAEVIRLTGNFWKNHGFCIDSKSYLYPEEALYLFQKDRVYVELDSAILEQKELYDQVLQCIPHSNFLTYLRLKVLIFALIVPKFTI